MTANSIRVFNFLKDNNGSKFSTKQIQEALGFEKPGAVTGSVNGLVKNERAAKTVEIETYVDENGKEKEKKVTYYTITEKGMAFDPTAVVEG